MKILIGLGIHDLIRVIILRDEEVKTYRQEEYSLFQEIEFNIADEAEARRGYYLLMEKYSHLFNDSEMEDLREIIAEELKHSILLNNMIRRRNGIITEK